jgi:hypothetical protein
MEFVMPERPAPQAEIETALIDANAAALSSLLRDNAATVTMTIGGLPPLLMLLRRSTGTPLAGPRLCPAAARRGCRPEQPHR